MCYLAEFLTVSVAWSGWKKSFIKGVLNPIFSPTFVYRRLLNNRFYKDICLNFSRHSIHYTTQKRKFSVKDFFSTCDQIRRKILIWSNLLTKSLMENFTFCAMLQIKFITDCMHFCWRISRRTGFCFSLRRKCIQKQPPEVFYKKRCF